MKAGLAALIMIFVTVISGCATSSERQALLKKDVSEILDKQKQEEEIKAKGKAADAFAKQLKELEAEVKRVEKYAGEKDPVRRLEIKSEDFEKRIKALEDKKKPDGSEEKEKGQEKVPPKPDAKTSSTLEDPLWGKLGFGLGVGAVLTIGRDRISSATTDGNNIVRIDKEQNVTPGVFLESHLLLKGCEWKRDCSNKEEASSPWAQGPFVSLTPGEAPLIRAIGIGWMVAYRYAEEKDSRRSFNLGVGLAIQPNSKTLGDGLNVNQPLPANDAIRYQERTLVGLIFMLSHGF